MENTDRIVVTVEDVQAGDNGSGFYVIKTDDAIKKTLLAHESCFLIGEAEDLPGKHVGIITDSKDNIISILTDKGEIYKHDEELFLRYMRQQALAVTDLYKGLEDEALIHESQKRVDKAVKHDNKMKAQREKIENNPKEQQKCQDMHFAIHEDERPVYGLDKLGDAYSFDDMLLIHFAHQVGGLLKKITPIDSFAFYLANRKRIATDGVESVLWNSFVKYKKIDQYSTVPRTYEKFLSEIEYILKGGNVTKK